MKDCLRVFLCDGDLREADVLASAFGRLANVVTLETFVHCTDMLDHLFKWHQTPDIIFLDINIPRQNGLVCLLEMRQHAESAGIPVIINTSSTLTNDVQAAFYAGANMYMTKSKEQSHIEDNLRHILALKTAELGGRSQGHFFDLVRYDA